MNHPTLVLLSKCQVFFSSQHIRDTYFLVNIVDNDYADENSDIFAIFKSVRARSRVAAIALMPLSLVYYQTVTKRMNADQLRDVVSEMEEELAHSRNLIYRLYQIQVINSCFPLL